MASRSINDLHPLLAYAFGKAEGKWVATRPKDPVPFLTATFRDNAEQDALFLQRPKVTNARAGQSPHNYQPAYAFDVAFKTASGSVTYDALLFGQFAKLVLETPGITWGGNFKSLPDKPHFEVTGWEKLVKK